MAFLEVESYQILNDKWWMIRCPGYIVESFYSFEIVAKNR